MVTIGTLRGVLELEDKFSAVLGRASENLLAFSDQSQRVGKTLTVALTAPLAAIATAATKTFLSFDTAMKGVEAALRPTTAELEKLEAAALEWGSKTQFSATQSATALMELGKAGLTVNESLIALPNVLNLATVGEMDLAEAATITTDIVKQMNLTLADSGRVNDVLAQGAQKSTADVNSLVQAMKFVGPVATGAGVSLENTVAMLANFHNVGIKAEIAGTSLRNIITDIINPTKGMRDGLQQLGLETLKTSEGTVDLAHVIDTLREKTDGVMNATDRTALVMRMFGKRGGVALAAVVNQGSGAFKELSQEMYGAQNVAQEVADTLMKGLGGTFARFTKSLEALGISIGAALEPALTAVLQFGTDVARTLNTSVIPAFLALPDSIQLAVGAFLLLTAAAGPALLIIGKVTEAFVLLGGANAAALVGQVLFNLGNTIPVLTARLWLLEASQAAVTASTIVWSTVTGAIKGVLDALGVSTAAQTTKVWLLDAAQKAATLSANALSLGSARITASGFGALAGALGTIVAVIGAVVGAVYLLTGSWEKTWDVLKIGMPPIWAAVEAWKAMKAAFDYLGPAIEATKSFFDDLFTVIGFIASGVLSDIAAVINDLATVSLQYLGQGLAYVKQLFLDVWEAIKPLAELVGGALLLGWNATVEAFRLLIPGLSEIIALFKGGWEWVEKFTKFVSGLRGELHELAEAARTVAPAVNTIPEMFKASKPALESADQLIARMGTMLDGEKELRAAIQVTGEGYQSYSERLAAAQKIVKQLTGEQRKNIDAGIKLNETNEQIATSLNKTEGGVRLTAYAVEVYKDQQKEAARYTREHNKELQDSEKFYKLVRTSILEVNKDLAASEKKRIDEAVKGMERSRDAILDALKIKVDAEAKTNDIIRQMTMSELEYKLDAIDREGKALKQGLDLTIGLHQQAAEAVDKLTDKSMEQLIKKSDEYRDLIITLVAIAPHLYGHLLPEAIDAGLGKLGEVKEKTEAWKSSLKELSQAFANMSEIGGGLGTFGKIAGEIISATDVAIQSFDKVSEGIKKLADSTKKDLAGALADISIGLVGGFGAMMEATAPDKSLTSKILGGAATGAALGMGIAATVAQFATSWSAAGPWAAAAGAVVGVVIAVFRGRGTRREMEIVGAEWGQDISKGLFDSIHNASQFGGDRVANSLARMSEFINEAGGVDPTNLEKFTGKLHDVFSLLEQDIFSIADAQKIVNENFGDIANASVAAGRLASDALIEIIHLNADMGVQAQEVINFVSTQLGNVGLGLQAIAAPITESVGKWQSEVVKTQDAMAKMTAEGKEGTEEWIVAQEKLVKLGEEHSQLVATNAADLENLGTVAVATFAAAVRSGVGYVQAIRQIKPGIDAIIGAQEKLGLTTDNQALKDLISFQAKVDQNATLVNAAEALDDTLLAVSHTTGLTEDSLRSMGQLGVSTFDKLIAAGFTEVQALRMMAPFLQDLIDGHVELGLPIDANVGKLVDMADQFDLLGKDSKDFEDVFANGIKTLTDAINELIKTMKGVPDTADNIGKAIDRIPKKVPIDIEWNVPDLDVPGGHVLQAHSGLPMQDWGPQGTLVALHDREGVYTDSQMRDIYANAQSRAASGVSSSGTTINVVVNAPGALLNDAASQQRLAAIFEEATSRVANQRRQVRA